MKLPSFLTIIALFLSLGMFAQTTAERAGTRAKNRAENRANSKVDQKVDQAVDSAFKSIGNLFKKKKKGQGAADPNTPAPAAKSTPRPAASSPSAGGGAADAGDYGNSMNDNSDPWEPYTNPISFSLTMNVTEVKKNGKEEESTVKMAVVSDKFGLHMFSDKVNDASSRMILNTQDGKTTLVTTTKKGETSAFRMRVPRMGKVLDNTTAEIENGRFTFEATGERKQVDGYNCEKYIVKDTKEGTTTVSWVTLDLNFDAQQVYRSFAGMAGASRGKGPGSVALAGGYKGFPIESTTTDGDKTFRMNFKDIKIGEDKMDKSLLDLVGVNVVDMGF